MDKNQILALLQQKIADGTISPADLAQFSSVAPAPAAAPAGDHGSLVSKVLYALGALVVIVGAGILIGDNWDTLGSVGRIFVSLGLALIAYVFGVVAAERGNRGFASVAYVVAVAMAPFGAAVVFDEFLVDPTLVAQAVAALVAAALFGFAALRARLPVPALGFAVAASWAYFALVVHAADRFGDPDSLVRAAAVIAGFAYAAVAWRAPMEVKETTEERQARGLRGLLGLAAVGSLISVGYSFEPDWRLAAALIVAGAGWFSVASRLNGALIVSILSIFPAIFGYDGVWSVLPLALSFGAIYAAIAARSSWALFFAAATVVGGITRVGGELFADVFGWALSLIAFGFLLIGAGYAAVVLNRRYITGAK